MKTNDLTGRLRPGMASLAIELGRPGLGTDFGDIQIVTDPARPAAFPAGESGRRSC
jgi:hypothetical protein